MLDFIIKNLVIMHKGVAVLRFRSTFMLALVGTPFAVVVEGVLEWFQLNMGFILFVFGAIIVDHLIGTYVHACIKKDFTLKKNVQGLVMKTALTVSVFFLGRGIVSILGEEAFVSNYLRTIMRLMVFLYPAGSALVNCSIITKGKFPPIGFMNKMNKFNSSLDFSGFKKGSKEEEV